MATTRCMIHHTETDHELQLTFTSKIETMGENVRVFRLVKTSLKTKVTMNRDTMNRYLMLQRVPGHPNWIVKILDKPQTIT